MSDPKEIYLEPICPKCGDQGGERQWCSDDVWTGDLCDGCGGEIEAIKYQRVPEGLVIVPREPTNKMIESGGANAAFHENITKIWQAMLGALESKK